MPNGVGIFRHTAEGSSGSFAVAGGGEVGDMRDVLNVAVERDDAHNSLLHEHLCGSRWTMQHRHSGFRSFLETAMNGPVQ